MKRTFAFMLCALLPIFSTEAKIAIPRFFSSNMVIQHDNVLTIPGQATPGSEISLNASWIGQAITTVCAQDGTFTLSLPTPEAGGPHTIAIKGDGSEILFDNILSGDVWLCSGQSNMEMPVAGWGKVNNWEQELADAPSHPEVRLLHITRQTSFTPLDDLQVNDGGWTMCDSLYVAEFSAIGYFFGRNINTETGVPVGIIDSSWGGTPCEAWSTPQTLSTIDEYSYFSDFMKDGMYDGTAHENYRNRLFDSLGFPGNGADPNVYHPDWASAQIPQPFSRIGLENVDGIVWFQYQFTLPQQFAGKAASLSLGIIDTSDETFINGCAIGRTDHYSYFRNYEVPEGVLKEENIISIKITDNSGEGGFLASPEEFFIKVDGETFPLAGEWKLAVANDFAVSAKAGIVFDPSFIPSVLYNAMIHPLRVLPIKGFLWYQGCSNVGRDKTYAEMFPKMIESWRKVWHNDDLPFYFVQLASFLEPVGIQPESPWAALRKAQTAALDLPRTGMVVATDIGNATDIHPKQKQEVAERFTRLALNNDYGRKCTDTAPVAVSACQSKKGIYIRFSAEVAFDNGKGFVAHLSDGSYRIVTPVSAKGKKLLLDPCGAGEITEILYNWADYGQGLLRCAESGLPVAPYMIRVK
ncbi:MAG: 9-O-acetylesterase [Bacteroidales bacterium]|nr:9-O-acetylesterase [Bacteroidales bacterium]